jgi:hypothetical protein
MSEPAVKRRLRRAKARVARRLERQGWTVFQLDDPTYHLIIKKGPAVKAVQVDISVKPGQTAIFKSL